MQKKKLIIFDMDGTLIDSGDAIYNTINHVRNNIGLDSMSKDILLTNMNNPDINSSEFFYGTKTFTEEQTILFTNYYNENCLNEIVLYDGIKDMLNSLEKHFKLSVATNASYEFATKMIKHLNIEKHFDMIIGANNVKKPKPDPQMIYDTLEKLKIKNNEAILIGDSHKDLRASNQAKIDCLLVNWGFTNHLDEGIIDTIDTLHQRLLILK
ncbi:MAG: HAD family hydrolase [Campylobacterota bacterium]|nr:HAD family hydrolase [Campylobacterota bacterium]